MTAADPIADRGNPSPLAAFRGSFAPTKPGFLYQAGLAVVAFAMVLLPAIYMALIAAATWSVIYHLKHNVGILSGGSGRAGLGRLIIYLGPAVAGAILVFFMVKPFFARKKKATEPVSLDPSKEPLLFAYVKKICSLVGAPAPCRIDVDCQVNASASLRRGLWSKDLVLTIGLPLASGLDMRQFGGVLAHEFGHFAQGAGLRLTYVIRNINFWFARVVYERDSWDVQLEQSARNSDFRIALVLHATRFCVWLTRRVLWVLMHAGHAISCFMLRQMEYDADSYEAKLAGSDAFESTAARMQILNVATQVAYEDVRQSWANHRLPENLTLLIDHKAASLPADVHQKISSAAASAKTGWFDTHPCDADRIRAARSLNEAGVFRLTDSATQLFANFGELSKAVTRHQYEKEFELEFTEQNLMPAEEILRESAANTEADSMVRKFYGGVNIILCPLLSEDALPKVTDEPGALSQWSEAQKRMDSLRDAAEKASAACVEQQGRLLDLTTANYLTGAGFQLEPGSFGLPDDAKSTGAQEAAAIAAMDQSNYAISGYLASVEPFVLALRERVSLALQLALMRNMTSAEAVSEIQALTRLLAAVAAQIPRLHQIGSRLRGFSVLAQNRAGHSDPAEVDKKVEQLTGELETFTGEIQRGLAAFAYPFAHARGQLTVAEYARSEKLPTDKWDRVYVDANAHLDRLFTLHYRLVGKILAHADAAEKALNDN
ncbi:MAG TPA: M48 family metallopeptidase [Verrucomicrobiae bacterium]|jgi:Zn-dependent protease with chaperone function